jgi:hypothetical protein
VGSGRANRIPLRISTETIHRESLVSPYVHHGVNVTMIRPFPATSLLFTLLTIYDSNAFTFVGTMFRRASSFSPRRVFATRTDSSFVKVHHAHHILRTLPNTALQLAQSDDDDKEDFDDRDLVKVPRGRRRGKYYNDDSDDNNFESSSRRSSSYFDQDELDLEDDDEIFDEDQIERELSDLFENVIIPNPLLDSMDPDGAAERFWPELARDPRFWLEFALFIAVLNFLSFAGPRDTLADLPFWS